MITWRTPLLLLIGGAVALVWASSAGVALWIPFVAVVGGIIDLALLDGLIAASTRRVTLRREGARRVRLGDTATVTLHVTNGGSRPLRAEVRDAWVPSAGAAPPYAHRLWIEPGATSLIDTDLTPTRRGDRPAAVVTIRSHGPLGLAYRQSRQRLAQARTPAWTLRVVPEFRARRNLPELLSRLRVIDGQVATRGRGQGSEFDSLREYVIGDDPRSIDWRGSARRETVVVKQFRAERDRRIICVLDTGRTSAARVADPSSPDAAEVAGLPRLDHALDAALLLATVAAHAGDRLDLLAIDTATHANVSARSVSTLPRITDALASLEPALVETDFTRVAAEVLTLTRKRALVVLLTTLDAGAMGEGLLPVLPSLASRHTVVVAAVHDPVLDSLAHGRADIADLHAAAAAERGLSELRRVRTALSRYGVHVVDAPAGTFARSLADTYLTLKATGQL